MREVSHLITLGDKSLMKSIWRRHLIICLFLVLLAIPIYCLDLALLGGRGGGNWITLDFRGLIFWTYITLLAIHVTLSSIAVLLFPRSGALRIHFGSMVLSLILLVAGFVVYGKSCARCTPTIWASPCVCLRLAARLPPAILQTCLSTRPTRTTTASISTAYSPLLPDLPN